MPSRVRIGNLTLRDTITSQCIASQLILQFTSSSADDGFGQQFSDISMDIINSYWISRAQGLLLRLHIWHDGFPIHEAHGKQLGGLICNYHYWSILGLQLSIPQDYDWDKPDLPGARATLDFVIQFDRETLQGGALKKPKPWSSDMNPADVAPPKGVPVMYLKIIEVDIHMASNADAASSQCTSEDLFSLLESPTIEAMEAESLSDQDALLLTSSQESILVPSLTSATSDLASPEPMEQDELLFENAGELEFSVVDQSLSVSLSFRSSSEDSDNDNRLPESYVGQNGDSNTNSVVQSVIEALLFGTSPCPQGFTVVDSSIPGGLCQLVPSIFNRLYLTQLACRYAQMNSISRTLSCILGSQIMSEPLKSKTQQFLERPMDTTSLQTSLHPQSLMTRTDDVRKIVWGLMTREISIPKMKVNKNRLQAKHKRIKSASSDLLFDVQVSKPENDFDLDDSDVGADLMDIDMEARDDGR